LYHWVGRQTGRQACYTEVSHAVTVMMKWVVVPLLTVIAGVSFAGDFATGQAARLVIGQYIFTAQDYGKAYSRGTITFSGTIRAGDQITVTIADQTYTYTVAAEDTTSTIAVNLAGVINGSNNGRGDPNVIASADVNSNILVLTARVQGPSGDTLTLSCKTSPNAQVVVTPSGKNFTGGQGADASTVGAVSGVAYANGRLIVADASKIGATPVNNRVLIYDTTTLPKPLDIINRERSPNIRCPVCVGTPTTVLGQPDFTSTDPGTSDHNLRTPLGVATDGVRLIIADTDNNRVLIWNTIPTSSNTPADLVLGQPDFTSVAAPRPPSAKSMRGPQGVWIQNGKLFVADTQNNRVLIWNSIPTTNGQPADVVLGQPNFTTAIEVDITKATVNPKADTLLSPVSVTSDGQRLYVTDLGNNRVLIWNSIPTTNQQPADVVVGQPDMVSAVANNAYTVDSNGVQTPVLCTTPNGTDSNNHPTYPKLCAATLNWPRFALSDGKWLFIADAGNDRVLVYKSVPAYNGAAADVVLGQPSDTVNLASDDKDSGDPLRRSSSDSMRTPMSLAWDGTNLWVSDPFNRRVLGFTLAEPSIPFAGIRNSAGLRIYSAGTLTIKGSVQAGDVATVNIAYGQGSTGTDYNYTVKADDTLESIVTNLVNVINSSNEGQGDPYVIATANLASNTIILTARKDGPDGNNIFFSFKSQDASNSNKPQVAAAASGANLQGGQDAAKVAPGTLISVLGSNLTDRTASADLDKDDLPTVLGGVRLYIDGIEAPLLYVSPTQINAQIPWETLDATSLSAYVRTEWLDGHVSITNAAAITLVPQNPALFAYEGVDPRPGVVLHYSNRATGTISVDGTATPGETHTININGREYSYTTQVGDTLATVRDAFISLINQDPEVEAYPAGVFTRIRLRARQPGDAGNGIPYSVPNPSGNLVLTPTTPTLCCANVAYSPVTLDNPALPGETIVVYGTGFGLIQPDEARLAIVDGQKYKGPAMNSPQVDVSSLAGNKTANVLYAGLKPGTVGIYELHLELNSDLETNPILQLVVSQDTYASNVITLPVRKGPAANTITATPNPCVVGQTGVCSVTINWAVMSNITAAAVFVAHGGTEEQFSGVGTSGSDTAPWITASEDPYVFNLYDMSSGSKGDLLASVTVTGVRPSP